ncbi:hypothetical protein AVEN_148914-1 [Araneus ventricosus]|uniref:Uncharacterized protein n=1 Tax=Araneus ventricosus TaxID=182803 RepID=A0A4Y2DI97_ARAVE|nr:hypothetical protein AVEN_148914-1 [Araneus ventricosus]
MDELSITKSSEIDMGESPVLTQLKKNLQKILRFFSLDSFHPVDTDFSLDGHTYRATSKPAANKPETERKEKESAKATSGRKEKESTKVRRSDPTLKGKSSKSSASGAKRAKARRDKSPTKNKATASKENKPKESSREAGGKKQTGHTKATKSTKKKE